MNSGTAYLYQRDRCEVAMVRDRHRHPPRLASPRRPINPHAGSTSTVGRTKGGEALAVDEVDEVNAQWFALWTHSHCEQLVHDQLAAKGFETFLPTVRTWSRRAGTQRLIPIPMFPSYLFVHQAMDKRSYIEIMKSKGLVRILGARWDRLTAVANTEIEALQRIQNTELAVMPHPYLHEGQRVRINAGPLSGVEGILIRSRPNRGLLVISVDLLRQSVAVEVDCTLVTPLGAAAITPRSASRTPAASPLPSL
jgi:transcription antitermination factor NusG